MTEPESGSVPSISGLARTIAESDGFKIFLLLLFIYMVTVKTIPVSDTQANNWLPWLLIHKHTIAFNYITRNTADYMYYPHAGHFYSNYPPGTALAALPIYLVPSLFLSHPSELWMQLLGKFSASIMMALSAVFIYLISRKLFNRRIAITTTVVFALGTTVWSMASQMLMTFSGSVLFLCLGIYVLVLGNNKKRYVVLSGLFFAWAAFCQPVNLLFLILFAVYVFRRGHKDLTWYACGAIPVLLVMGAYQWLCYGSPLRNGEFLVPGFLMTGRWGARIPFSKLWGTPLHRGLPGYLFSPSRGLFTWSPVLLFAFWGLIVVWKKRGDYSFLAYGALGSAILVLIASKWFDWAAGNSYGYRTALSTVPFLALLVGLSLQRVKAHRALAVIFLLLLTFSIGVQLVGYLSYDGGSWEQQYLRIVTSDGRMIPLFNNIWSRNNQLAWEAGHFKFYVPAVWQGIKPHPADVTKVVNCEAKQSAGSNQVRIGVTTTSPRIARLIVSVQPVDGEETLATSSSYVPRGKYTVWLRHVPNRGKLSVFVRVNNVGVEDSYIREFIVN